MVPPEASACTLWGGMSSCGLSITTIMILDKLVLRSAPHVLRLSRYDQLQGFQLTPYRVSN